MRYESWVERQIREAIERGEFDNLPGQGRPIKGLNGREDENWWVKAYLEREQLPLPLPTSLALRREVMALPETLADVADEESVREIVRDLNRRIAESHRIRVDGPAIVIGLVNVDRAVADWRAPRALVADVYGKGWWSQAGASGNAPVRTTSAAISCSLRLLC